MYKTILCSLFFCLAIVSNSQNISDDKKLLELRAKLPPNWELTLTETKVVIQSKDSVYEYYRNIINAPYHEFNKKLSSDEVATLKKNTKAVHQKIIFTYEPAWNKEKELKIKARNDSIYGCIKALVGIREKTTSGKNEYHKLNEQAEIDELYKQIIKPAYQTEKYYLFNKQLVGCPNELTGIYPENKGDEFYQVINITYELLAMKEN